MECRASAHPRTPSLPLGVRYRSSSNEKSSTHSQPILAFRKSCHVQRLRQVGLSYTYSEGYLSDPYKLLDARPEAHERVALSLGYRQFFIAPDASLQIDYRYYGDSWGTDSHTVELGWAQNLSGHLITPYLRYYSQRQADFYTVIADTSARHYADDYRLSSFGALTIGARWAVALGDQWTLQLEAERYETDASWSLYSGAEASRTSQLLARHGELNLAL